MSARKSNAGKMRPEIVAKQQVALQARIAGANFETIAQQVGYRSPASAWKAVKAALLATIREPAEEVRNIELDRLDRLMLAWWNRATGGRDPKTGEVIPPDGHATDRVLKIMRHREELLGLQQFAVKLDVGAKQSIDPETAARMIAAGLRSRESGESNGDE